MDDQGNTMARRTMLGLMAGGVSALLGGCGLLGGNSYHFKMTVEVETPQGLRTGSSVYEVYADKRLALTSEEAEISDGLRGQALIVDLPQGPVFALLKRDGTSGLYLHRAVTAALNGQMFKDLPDLIAMTGKLGGAFAGTAKAELPRKDWPLMVRFKDINDPKSVERVDPDAIGVKRILLETTSDDLTAGVEKRLSWIENGQKLGITPTPSAKGIPLGNFRGLFSTELAK